MRILFNNEAIASTNTSLHENSSYPLSNIKHNFLKKIYKSTETSDVITLTFLGDKTINCCYLGFTNATSATLRLYTSLGVLLSTHVLNVGTNGGYFGSVSGVRYCTLTLSSTELIFIGNIGIGNSYKLPDPRNNIIKGKVDNSNTFTSKDGQFSQNKIPWLKRVSTDHHAIGIEAYNEIYALFADIERPVWVDIYEELDYGILPFYATIEFKEKDQSWRKYDFGITTTEAR